MSRREDAGDLASTPLVGGLDHPCGIQIDATHIYVTTGGFRDAENGIRRAPLEGGTSELIARTDVGTPSGHLALHGELVFWTVAFGGAVVAAPKRGGEILHVADAGDPHEIAVGHGYVYWIDGGVYRRGLREGSPVECLASRRRSAGELIVQDDWVWWRQDTGLWRFRTADPSAASPELVLPNAAAGRVGPIALGGDTLFCSLVPKLHSQLVAVPMATIDDPLSFRILAERLNGTAQICVDERHVYFFGEQGLTEDVLCRVARSGGTVERLCEGGSSTGRMVLGPLGVYWTDIESVRLTRYPA